MGRDAEIQEKREKIRGLLQSKGFTEFFSETGEIFSWMTGEVSTRGDHHGGGATSLLIHEKTKNT